MIRASGPVWYQHLDTKNFLVSNLPDIFLGACARSETRLKLDHSRLASSSFGKLAKTHNFSELLLVFTPAWLRTSPLVDSIHFVKLELGSNQFELGSDSAWLKKQHSHNLNFFG